MSRAERHALEKWEDALAINLTAVFLCCQKVGRYMIERGQGGRIINISSVLGEGANTVHKTVGYAATKGAVTNMTRQLAVEWAPYGITVNALAPSWFPTEMITDPRLGRVHDEQQARMELFTLWGDSAAPEASGGHYFSGVCLCVLYHRRDSARGRWLARLVAPVLPLLLPRYADTKIGFVLKRVAQRATGNLVSINFDAVRINESGLFSPARISILVIVTVGTPRTRPFPRCTAA